MKKILIFISILLIFLVPAFFILNKYRKMRVLSGISNEDYLIFSANFHDGNKGTFKYYISSGEIEKISDYIFSDLSYSDDHKYILGTAGRRDFEGLAEIELSSNRFNSIIDFNEIDALLSNMGMDKLKYRYFKLSLRPKYYGSGYTFYNDMFDPNTLLYIEKVGDSWNIKKLYETEKGTLNYFMEEGDKEDTLIVAANVEEESPWDKIYDVKCSVIKRELTSGKEELLFKFPVELYTDKRGCMDMNNDKSKIVYFADPYIHIYDCISKKVEDTIILKNKEWNEIVDLKFSPDGKYLFYTFGKDPFFPGTPRLRFMLLNLETKKSVELKRWADGDDFYGFDW